MRSFTAQIIYRIICEGIFTEQYEEQWRIMFASDETHALEEAKRTGKTEECKFMDRHGRQIEWQLIAVKDIQEIAVAHGALLFSMVRDATPVAAPLWALS